MIGRDANGGALSRSPRAATDATAMIGRYQPNPTPRKQIWYHCDGRSFPLKGQRPAFMDALIATGASADGKGLAHVDCLPWMLNPGDVIMVLRKRHGLSIETRTGDPSRYVLHSFVTRLEARP